MGVILGFARNGEPSRAPQHAPKIILGALLLCTLDIKIARIVLIFNLVLVLHAPLPKKHFIITYFEATFLLLSKLVLNWHPRNDSVMSFLWRLYVRDSILLIYFFPKNFTYETNNIQHLNTATILRPLYLRDINDCFCVCSKHTIAQEIKILDNVTPLSGHKFHLWVQKRHQKHCNVFKMSYDKLWTCTFDK